MELRKSVYKFGFYFALNKFTFNKSEWVGWIKKLIFFNNNILKYWEIIDKLNKCICRRGLFSFLHKIIVKKMYGGLTQNL